MPVVCFSEDQFYFPSLQQADEDGLLLIGGNVTAERVLEAYPKAIFPWYSEAEIPLWWSPDPRFVLFPEELHISRSMHKLLRKNVFEFRVNTAFDKVIDACSSVPREGQDGTWLTPEMKFVYTDLHYRGFAYSAETWLDNQLVGGVYGIMIGRVFFGESMFSQKNNASKFAFINWVQQVQQKGVQLIDCQVFTPHVASLGARLIPRKNFTVLLQELCR